MPKLEIVIETCNHTSFPFCMQDLNGVLWLLNGISIGRASGGVHALVHFVVVCLVLSRPLI